MLIVNIKKKKFPEREKTALENFNYSIESGF